MHPTVKPVAMVADAVKDCSDRKAVILGPFMGSGTTLIAAERTGRRARGIEIDPVYVDTAVRRWQAHTGEPAAIAEAVQRPTMKFVATKTADQLDLQALHRVRERLIRQRTGIINQISAFLLERGIAVRQGVRFLRKELPGILAKRCDVLSPRMMRIIEDLASDRRRLPPTSRAWWKKTQRASV